MYQLTYKEIAMEIRKYLKLKKYEYTTYPNYD